jgi:hypothetical protein
MEKIQLQWQSFLRNAKIKYEAAMQMPYIKKGNVMDLEGKHELAKEIALLEFGELRYSTDEVCISRVKQFEKVRPNVQRKALKLIWLA